MANKLIFFAVCWPKQQYDLSTIHTALPVLHKYDFTVQLKECDAALDSLLPARLTLQASSDGYVLAWLQLASGLQLDGIRARWEGLGTMLRCMQC